MRGVVSAVLVVVVVSTVVPSVAVAQDGSGGGGGGGGGGGIGIGAIEDAVVDPLSNQLSTVKREITSEIPRPADVADEVVGRLPDFITDPVQEATSWIVDGLSGIVGDLATVLDDVVTLATFVPAPGDPTDPTTWTPVDGNGTPANTIWGDVYEATLTNMALAIVLLAISGALNFRYASAVKRRKAWKAWAVSFTMVVLTWFLAPFGLHLASTLADGYAPGAVQFFQGVGSFANLGYGIIVGAVVLVLFPTVAFIALLAVGIQMFLLFLVVFFWPLGWACLSFEQGYMHSLGKFMVNLYSGLLALNIGQAMVLHLLFAIDFTQASVSGTLLSLVIIPGGVLFATVLLPWGMLKQISTGVGVNLGMRDMSYKAERAGKYASQVAPKVQKRLDQIDRTGRAFRSAKSRASGFASRFRSSSGSNSTDPPTVDGPALPSGERRSPTSRPQLPSGEEQSVTDTEAGDDGDDPSDGGSSVGHRFDGWSRTESEIRRERERRRHIQNKRRRSE